MRRLSALGLLVALVLSGCGSGAAGTPEADRDAPAAGRPTSFAGPTGTVTVLAASSLTESLTTIARDVERAYPGLTVQLSFGASSTLAQQVLAGAPAEVVATASTKTLQQVADAGQVVGTPAVFARNVLEIATPPGNPAGVTGLRDFARPELTIALCAEQVPCGAAADKALAAAGVTAAPDTLERDVKAVLAKVRLGEVDAGLVYRTDVRAAGKDVRGVPFPESGEAVTDYPVAVLSGAPNPAAARVLVDALMGEPGQRVLAQAGFAPAPAPSPSLSAAPAPSP